MPLFARIILIIEQDILGAYANYNLGAQYIDEKPLGGQ